VGVTGGSWGDVVCGGGVVVYSHTALVVAFEPPPNASYSPVAYMVQVGTSESFSTEGTARTISVTPSASLASIGLPASLSPSALRCLVTSLSPQTLYHVRVGVVPPALPPDVAAVLFPRLVPVVYSAVGAPGEGCACASVREGSGCVAVLPANVSATAPQRPVIGAYALSVHKGMGQGRRLLNLCPCASFLGAAF
jgi:hypothetical protein